MSQSDYIKYKKTIIILNKQADLNPILAPSDYLAYKDYNLETTVTNNKPIYHKLTPPGKQMVFDMEKTMTSCPTFILCNNTNKRENRRPLDAGQSACFPIMKAPGRSVPVYPQKPTFNTYVRQNYRVTCDCVNNSCSSRACRMKYNCAC